MAEITRISLVNRLNPLLLEAAESAHKLCLLRGNSHVELVHWLNQIFQLQESDFSEICTHFNVDASALATDLNKSLDKLPSGATSVSNFSQHFDEAIQEAWLYASLAYQSNAIRSGHLVLALVKSSSLKSIADGISSEFSKIKSDALSENFAAIVDDSPENLLSPDPISEPGSQSTKALDKYTVNLGEQAKSGALDPVIGREAEISKLVDILMRRRQNNPILTGEAGVGKTAVVEGFALKVAEGDVPPPLKGVGIRALDLGLLQAGASVKGAFEERLKAVIDEINQSPTPIILFIDEAHTLIGAGGQAGTGDAANLLKPELARGTLRTVAATTWAEYKKYFEKDPALTRRFQVVKVEEPEEPIAVAMLRGIYPSLTKHHKVPILESALESAVSMSKRYLPDRLLPDKAVSVLDTACARVAVSQFTVPPQISLKQKERERLALEKEHKEREQQSGSDYKRAIDGLSERIAVLDGELETLNLEWRVQKSLVTAILAKTEGDEATQADDDKDESLESLKADLAEKHKSHGLVFPFVDERVVAEVVSGWTGIPLGHMVEDTRQQMLELHDRLSARVFGQNAQLEYLANHIKIARSGLGEPDAPMGVFLFAGSSGVGKTETALALADLLYGGEQNLITINMSEFQESHTVSTLKGAPPGYVGYGEGGVLTEAVRRRPFSVVLLDEVEKAHPDIHEIFFQVFDKGWMEDGEGRYIDFKNTLILLTSNVGSDELLELLQEGGEPAEVSIDDTRALISEPLRQTFPDAFIGRLNVIPFMPLGQSAVQKIVSAKLGKVLTRFTETYDLPIHVDEAVEAWLLSMCNVRQSGARLIGNVISKALSTSLSQFVFENVADFPQMQGVSVSLRQSEEQQKTLEILGEFEGSTEPPAKADAGGD